MPPRMRIVEKKIGDVERRPPRLAHRRLLERSPSDEDAILCGLDESEVSMHIGCWVAGFLGCYDTGVPSNRATPQPSNPAQIRKMFGAIATRYDRANTILSGGIHHLWRRRAVFSSGIRAGEKVLDCATGTGDLAIAFAKAGANVIGTDFTPEMIALARAKAPAIRFEVAD